MARSNYGRRKNRLTVRWLRWVTVFAGCCYIFFSWCYYIRIEFHYRDGSIAYLHHRLIVTNTSRAYRQTSNVSSYKVYGDNSSFGLFRNKYTHNKKCAKAVAPYPVVEQQKFIQTEWIKAKQYFFSALYNEQSNEVVIVSDVTGHGTSTLFCMFSFLGWPRVIPVKNMDTHTLTGKKDNQSIFWRSNKLYYCPVPKELAEAGPPYAVQISFLVCSDDAVLLPVVYKWLPTRRKHSFGVCVPPFSNNYSKVDQLMDFIEANRIFGAEKFVFYNYSISPSLNPVLKSYMSDGVIEVIQWPLYPGAEGSLVYYGQLASMYDCHYRNKHKFHYLTFLDLDEVLATRSPSYRTWSDIVTYKSSPARSSSARYSHARSSPARRPAVWVFRCAFFRMDWPDGGPLKFNVTVKSLSIQPLLKVWREKTVWKVGKRSKYIIDSSQVSKLTVHMGIVKLNYRREVIPVQHGLLHHYRSWEAGNVSEISVKAEGREDLYMMSYADRLINAIKYRRGRIAKQFPFV